MPSVVGGGSSIYFCDYHYTNIPTTEALRGVLFGGHAYNGSYAGFASALSSLPPSHANALIGSRLCFKSSALAKYAGEQFAEIYFAFVGK